jgi:hypothetical protein
MWQERAAEGLHKPVSEAAVSDLDWVWFLRYQHVRTRYGFAGSRRGS